MRPGYQEQILYILNKHHSIVTVELGDAVTDDILQLIDSAKREAYKEGYILGGIDVLTKQETARTVQMAKDIEQDNGKRD